VSVVGGSRGRWRLILFVHVDRSVCKKRKALGIGKCSAEVAMTGGFSRVAVQSLRNKPLQTQVIRH